MNRINRVKHNLDFDRIIKNGTSLKEDIVNVYYVRTPGPLRVGIAVSKKIGIAVVRNKIKRQIRSIMMELITDYKDIEIVIIVKSKFLHSNYEYNKKALIKLMAKTEK